MLTELKWKKKALEQSYKNLPWFWAHHGTSHTVFFPSIFSDRQGKKVIFVYDFEYYESLFGVKKPPCSSMIHFSSPEWGCVKFLILY